MSEIIYSDNAQSSYSPSLSSTLVEVYADTLVWDNVRRQLLVWGIDRH